jgi:hypothetical protein
MNGGWWLKAAIGDRLAGCGAYDIKQRLGFVLESNHFARYAVQGRWMHWLARRLA